MATGELYCEVAGGVQPVVLGVTGEAGSPPMSGSYAAVLASRSRGGLPIAGPVTILAGGGWG